MKRNKYCGLWPGLSVLRNSIPVQNSIFANSWDPGIFWYSIGLRWKKNGKQKDIEKKQILWPDGSDHQINVVPHNIDII